MSEQTHRHDFDSVNFLPGWYVADRRRGAARKRQMLLAAVMIGAMAMLWHQSRQQTEQLSLYRDSLAAQLQAAEGQITEMVKLQKARAELSRQVNIYRQLALPINYSQVSGTVAALTPDDVFLDELEVRTEQLREKRVVGVSNADRGGRKRNAKPQTIVETRTIITVDIRGIAPNDVAIANFVGQLAASDLFQNVKMVYSRQGKIGNAITREFYISMHIPLDKDYEPRAAQEVADAS